MPRLQGIGIATIDVKAKECDERGTLRFGVLILNLNLHIVQRQLSYDLSFRLDNSPKLQRPAGTLAHRAVKLSR